MTLGKPLFFHKPPFLDLSKVYFQPRMLRVYDLQRNFKFLYININVGM